MPTEPPRQPLVTPMSPEELAIQAKGLAELLDSWVTDGDEEEQRETLAILKEALENRRIALSGRRPPLIPPISPEELARRNKAALALINSWATEGDEAEQRETRSILREALGKNRSGAARNLFP